MQRTARTTSPVSKIMTNKGLFMSVCDMQGYATTNELSSLYRELKVMKAEERASIPFALFVIGRGMLNGNEALAYLEEKYFKAN